MFVHYSLGEKLKPELEHGVPLPWKEACSVCFTTSVYGFLLKLSLKISKTNPNTSFSATQVQCCKKKKKKKTFLTLLKIFFHPIKGFNPKVDGASTFLILVCLKWANLMLLFKTACYFSWSVCLFSGPVLSSYCLF